MSLPKLLLAVDIVKRHNPDLGKWFDGALQGIKAGEEPANAFSLLGASATREVNAHLMRAVDLLDPSRKLTDWAVTCKIIDAYDSMDKKMLRGDSAQPTPGGLYFEMWSIWLIVHPYWDASYPTNAVVVVQIPKTKRRMYERIKKLRHIAQ